MLKVFLFLLFVGLFVLAVNPSLKLSIIEWIEDKWEQFQKGFDIGDDFGGDDN